MRAPPAIPQHRTRQRGSAVISALLIATLAIVIVSGLLWQQQVRIRAVENLKLQGQANWLMRGTHEWVRVLLASTRNNQSDHLGQAWAVPIAETPLSEFLGPHGGEDTANVFLSGQAQDAQARFNLTNLLESRQSPDDDFAPATASGLSEQQIKAFARLLSALGMNQSLAEVIGKHMLQSLRDNPPDASQRAPRPRPIQHLRDLLAIPGITPPMLERLAPHIIVLPRPGAINVNTAGPLVLAAAIPDLTLANARQLAESLTRIPVNNAGELQSRLAGIQPNLELPGGDVVDTRTSYFLITLNLRVGRANLSKVALVSRRQSSTSTVTRIISVSDTDETSF